MQNYTEIPSSTTLSDSLSQILNNDKTSLSLSSGTSFPTVNLQLGMPCFRTDEQKLYILTVVSPASWKMVIDLSATVGKVANADLLDGIDSTGFALSGHNHDAAYAALGHNHNATYLGITAKAADADKLDGYDSTAFVRSVNGYGPDANGNSSVPIDLSSRVAKSGDTMTGTLTVPRLQIASTANYLDMVDQDWGTRYLHHNQGLMGFLKSDGNWDMYMNNSGQMWTANYGWLHDYFFNAVSNCFRTYNPSAGWQGAPNCVANTADYYNCGDQPPNTSYYMLRLADGGSTISFGSQTTRFNCNCACDCC
ncbi:MAG: hypothetical protein ACK5BY_01325 [Limnohabitans sp.]|jgi:hypothetical protein|uniref:hypothetical protein n=1 Tax=Limnohabitans sp. TaxID=1907725 RepID=UPI0039195ABB